LLQIPSLLLLQFQGFEECLKIPLAEGLAAAAAEGEVLSYRFYPARLPAVAAENALRKEDRCSLMARVRAARVMSGIPASMLRAERSRSSEGQRRPRPPAINSKVRRWPGEACSSVG
jgi:hypothetical protein